MDVKSELRGAQIEITDTDYVHSANKKGLIWFNRALDKLKILFNSEVKTIATEDWVNDRISTDINDSETTLAGAGLITAERTDPVTPSSGFRHIYAKSDGVYERGDNGTVSRLLRESEFIKPSVAIDSFASGNRDNYGTVGSVSISLKANSKILVTLNWTATERAGSAPDIQLLVNGSVITTKENQTNGQASAVTFLHTVGSAGTYTVLVQARDCVWEAGYMVVQEYLA